MSTPTIRPPGAFNVVADRCSVITGGFLTLILQGLPCVATQQNRSYSVNHLKALYIVRCRPYRITGKKVTADSVTKLPTICINVDIKMSTLVEATRISVKTVGSCVL